MRPCAGTVGRAVIGLTSVPVGCDAPTSAPSGYAPHSNYGLLTMLRHPRGCAGARFSI